MSSRTVIPDASAASLKIQLEAHRRELIAELSVGAGGADLGRRNALWLEELLKRLWAHNVTTSESPHRVMALAVVGGMARGTLCLRSDADLRLIVDADCPDDVRARAAEALFYPLWDVGLSIGHQVIDRKSILDSAEDDISTATSLLEMRWLAGDRDLVDRLVEKARHRLFSEAALPKFMDRLHAEAAERHVRYGGSLYLLEPDIKNAAGGLRDLDGVKWAMGAWWSSQHSKREAPAAVDFWQGLADEQLFEPREASDVRAAENFLLRVRNRLHAHADRRSDRLTFEEQESVAREMGYDVTTNGSKDDRAEAAERLMQDYYLHARVVARIHRRVLDRARPAQMLHSIAVVSLGSNLEVRDDRVVFREPSMIASDPSLALRAYAECVRHRYTMSSEARDAIADAATDPAWCVRLRASAEAAQLFVDLVCSLADTRFDGGSILSELHDVGLLFAMIPEFGPVIGRVHHDVYHVYTVDVHSVAAVDRFRSIARGELNQTHALATRLSAEVVRLKPLVLAILLHDIGKGYPDRSGSRKDHSKAGADLCETILPRLALSRDDIDEVKNLILHHLAMYHVAMRRDLDDASTIQAFCRLVSGAEGLRALYLLTVVDLTTTSPTAMTRWKAALLDTLYFAAEVFLSEPARDALSDRRIAHVQESAMHLWTGNREFFTEFLAAMPSRYFLANSDGAIAMHAATALAFAQDGVGVAWTMTASDKDDVLELCVVADDRPGVLACVSAAITGNRFEVLAAQLYSRSRARRRGSLEAVDLFWLRCPDSDVDGALARFAIDLPEVLAGTQPPDAVIKRRLGSPSPWRQRASPAVATEVVVDDRSSQHHTVVEVVAKDRPGLLFDLAWAFYELQLSITLSKINTEGARVVDVFYVQEFDGSKVQPGARSQMIHDALCRAAESS